MYKRRWGMVSLVDPLLLSTLTENEKEKSKLIANGAYRQNMLTQGKSE